MKWYTSQERTPECSGCKRPFKVNQYGSLQEPTIYVGTQANLPVPNAGTFALFGECCSQKIYNSIVQSADSQEETVKLCKRGHRMQSKFCYKCYSDTP